MKSVIILDWDDTLFPTSWLLKNNISLFNITNFSDLINFFKELDSLVYDIISSFIKCGKVFIVTNASMKWISVSSKVLPKTSRLLMNDKIGIISARDEYTNKYPKKNDIWKSLVFKNIIISDNYKFKYQNIISAGDADYEFKALTNLYDRIKSQQIYLKSIRFSPAPGFKELLDELEILQKSTKKICQYKRHMDLKFFEKN